MGGPRGSRNSRSGPRSFPHRLGAFTSRGLIARQLIGDLEPSELLADVCMSGRWPLRGVIERAVKKVHFTRPTRTGVGQGCAAVPTKIALYAHRGGIGGGLARQIAELLAPNADIGRKR